MKRLAYVLFTWCIVVACISNAGAAIVWSNGDTTDQFVPLGFNAEVPSYSFSRQFFEEFTVNGGTMITGLWSHNLIPTGTEASVTIARWSIYSLMTPSSDGTLISEGIANVSLSPNGKIRSETLNFITGPVTQQFDGYQFLVSGLNVALGSGTYSVAVTPILDSFIPCFEDKAGCSPLIELTYGANSIGTPVGNENGVWRDTMEEEPVFRYNNTAADLPLGVLGVSAVPLPNTMLLLGLGLMGVAGIRRKLS